MSDQHEVYSVDTADAVTRARGVMKQRGGELSQAALKTLAREVILRMAQKPEDPGSDTVRTVVDKAAVVALCDALLSPDEQAAAGLVREARLGGMDVDQLYFSYIADAVRMLGERWDNDEATVPQVIIGTGRVYGIMRELRSVFLSQRVPQAPGAEAVFAQVPGEIHTIGVMMAADALRRDGWEIDLRLGLAHDALVEEIARMQPSILGLSASTRQQTFALARLIVAIRVRCPQVWILVAGQIVPLDDNLRDLVDADAVAATLSEATEALDSHLTERGRLISKRG